MNKVAVYDEFLKSFRIAITNTAIYFKEHPLFIKSVQDLKSKINRIFSTVNSLKIGISSTYLIINDEQMGDTRLREDLAHILHRRKVRNIEIKKQVTVEELANFLTKVNLSPKDIIMQGGLGGILKNKAGFGIEVEDLDYTQFLEGEGEECEDIWFYLLDMGFQQDDSKKIKQLADSFIETLPKMDIKNLVEDEEKEKVINKLFAYLKDKDKDKFFDCANALVKVILKSKYTSEDSKSLKSRMYFDGISGDDFSGMLLEQFQGSAKAESLNVELMSQLVNSEKHKEIAHSLADKLRDQEHFRCDSQVVDGIKKLTSLFKAPYISEIYRNSLSLILENISTGGSLSLDYAKLQDNYRFILLALLTLESEPKRLELILGNILVEFDKAAQDNDLKYVEDFVKILEEKKKKSCFLEDIFQEADKHISEFVENALVTGDTRLNFEYFINILGVSTLDARIYLDRIFKENGANSYILKLFFKFFPQKLSLFCKELNKETLSPAIVKKIMESLRWINSAWGLDILKRIFYSSNVFIKIGILKIMQSLPLYDKDFLYSILKAEVFFERKYAFLVLAKHPETKKEAARLLLLIPNFYGLKGRFIEENLSIISEAPFAQSREYLLRLSKYRFFWNRNIRGKAKEILDGLNEGH